MDSTRRSIAKAVSWRVVATAITASVVFAATGRIEFAATIGAVDTVIKFFTYLGHERLWNQISYGRSQKEPEYYI